MEGWIDPVIFSLGPLQVRWYGLMYVIGFLLGTQICKKLARDGFFKVAPEKVDTLITYLIIGMFIGARIFYVFIYNWDEYSQNLGDIFAVWKGGLSFHGALTGMLAAGYLFARKFKISWGQVMDVVALAGTQGLFWGRLGNFINGELYGRVTDSAFGIVFPGGGPYPRHPSQLYEGVMEGIVLTIILWAIYPRVKKHGVLSCVFLMGYAVFRYFIEFFRQPDSQLGYYLGGTTTMGQILCIGMFLVGIAGVFYIRKKNWQIDFE
ncbi:MAG: prolipoprotein diacylglyceryl transferase [Bacteriovoracaceae bacterium]